MVPWVEKYKPKSTKEIIGQDAAVAAAKKFLATYKPGQPPLLFIGKSGTGKTALVHALSQETERELIEINASDTRNAASMEALLGPVLQQQSLFFQGKLIFIDELDGLSGVKDRGAASTLIKLIDKSAHPIIMAATEDDDKIKALKKVATIVEFTVPNTSTIATQLDMIAKKEHVVCNETELIAVARRSGGDMRAAINDFQSIANDGKITKDDLEFLSDREHREEIEQALMRVFKTTSAEVALPSFDNVDEQPDKIILWMDENIPKEYTKPADLARALNTLADADKFFGRIRRWQYYRYYVYLYNLLSAGIALAKDEKYTKASKYKQPDRLLKIWIYNRKNLKKKQLAEQLASQLHTSKKRVQQDMIPYLQHIWKKNKEFRKTFTETYTIDKELTEVLSK